jgi:hypothetical protein
MKTTVKKVFIDIHKEVEWLNQQGDSGLMLIGYRNGEYDFEDVSPAKYMYTIELPNYSGEKKKKYFAFLEQSGISVAAEYAGRVYLRKNAAEGPLELYTDTGDANRQIRKRYAYLICIGISQIGLGIILLIQMMGYLVPKSAPFWICSVFGTILVLSGTVFLTVGIRKQLKHSIRKDDLDVWE